MKKQVTLLQLIETTANKHSRRHKRSPVLPLQKVLDVPTTNSTLATYLEELSTV